MSEPVHDLVPEQPVDRVLGCPQLMAETVLAEDRNSSVLAIDRPALPGDPDVEVQKTGRVRQSSNDFTLDWNGVGGDLVVEGLAQRDGVSGCAVIPGLRFSTGIEPKTHGVDEVEASRVHNDLLDGFPFGAKENRGGEDALKGSFDPAVLASVLGEVEIVE